jgi:hypothetical protein
LVKPRGDMGMTWKYKVQRGAFVVAIVAGLALASGANWISTVDWSSFFNWIF